MRPVRRQPLLVPSGIVALILLASHPLAAQQPGGSTSDDHARVEQLLKRVADLEQEVSVLRAAGAAAAPATQVPETAVPPQPGADAHEAAMMGAGPLRIRGFGDIDFRTGQKSGRPNTFSVGAIDLFLSSKIADRFSTVGELVFEPDEANAWGVDAERMLIQYSANDYFTIAAGRYHTAIGYYNAAYHHGTWFQTATGRPFIFNFEDQGGILPIHGVGVTMQGRIPSGALGLRYVAEIANGRASASAADEPVQNRFDENRHKAVNVALVARPDWLVGLQAGFSVYRDRLTPTGQAAVGETIMAVHAAYQASDFEFLNEGVFIRHAPESQVGATTTNTFYSQISRQFGRYRPYFRYEYVNIPDDDTIFGEDIGRLQGPSFGLRFDAAEPIAVKVQFNHLFGPARARTNGLTTQLAFTF